MPPILDAAGVYATVGEISDRLRGVFGWEDVDREGIDVRSPELHGEGCDAQRRQYENETR